MLRQVLVEGDLIIISPKFDSNQNKFLKIYSASIPPPFYLADRDAWKQLVVITQE